MKTTNIAQAIAKAVLHAGVTHGVSFADMFVVLTSQQLSTLHVQHASSCGTALPPKGCYGVASEAPADKVLITISSIIQVGDRYDVTHGNDGCVEVPMKMNMTQLVLLLQNYGVAIGEAGDKAKVSLDVTRKGKQAEEAINEVKGKLDALLADMLEKQRDWFMLHMLDASQARQTLYGFVKRLQEIVS